MSVSTEGMLHAIYKDDVRVQNCNKVIASHYYDHDRTNKDGSASSAQRIAYECHNATSAAEQKKIAVEGISDVFFFFSEGSSMALTRR